MIIFSVFLFISALGYITSLLQFLVVFIFKDSIELAFEKLFLEGAIVFCSVYTFTLTI